SPDCAPGSCHDTGPLVTLIVAARDAETTIDAALLSLLRQSWRALEILVVDDASSDGTVARIEALARADSRLKLIRLAANAGAYAARNAGIAKAEGAFIGFHDADDVAHPHRIARQIAPFLKTSDLAFSLTRWTRRTAAGFF